MKKLIQTLLGQAGITVNGNQPWDIEIHNEKFYEYLAGNDIAFAIGNAYVNNFWDCKRLDQFFYRVFIEDLEKKALSSFEFWQSRLKKDGYRLLHRIFNYQTQKKAQEVGELHYDIGNNLYAAMLGKTMIYSCAYWEGAQSLEEAQERKLELICKKLRLAPGMHILDIGCGWGGFAKYAAEHYQVTVVGLTISKEQQGLAQKICQGLPIDIRLQDYRQLLAENIQYDRVVSVGMFEHVGYKNYQHYMRTVAHILKNNGLFLLHTIGSNRSDIATNQWIDTYIFPNGQLPSIMQLGSAIEGIFVMEDWQNLGIHYDKTLMAWHRNFTEHWAQLKSGYDERFRRMWEYYLLSCAAAFRARKTQVWQVVLSKNGLPNGYSYAMVN